MSAPLPSVTRTLCNTCKVSYHRVGRIGLPRMAEMTSEVAIFLCSARTVPIAGVAVIFHIEPTCSVKQTAQRCKCGLYAQPSLAAVATDVDLW